MLNTVTWASYIKVAAIVLIIYYLIIVYKCYREDILELLAGRKQLSKHQLEKRESDADHRERYSSGNPLIQSLTGELQVLLYEAGANNLDRDQILPSLQMLLQKFPSVQLSPYKDSIQKLIAQECATHCSVHLSEAELEGLWMK